MEITFLYLIVCCSLMRCC